MRPIFASACILALTLSGCARPGSKLSGGKPVGYWVQAIQTGDAKLRKKAVFKLGNVGTTDPTALPAVIAELKDQDPAVRCEAILAVVKNGPATRVAIPALNELRQNDPNPHVRSYAAQAWNKFQAGM